MLLETGEHELFAFAEGQGTTVLCASPSKVSSLTRKRDRIRMHSLNVEESAEFIRRVAEKQ
ncbi:hypothetical protein ABZ770_28890 [Streptomyces sp. NPDC006654]|uniref:hypothetical protein n=1 Tax=Streptomyces sp. NPDC006654 TaxID=3156897 RepID=UPI00340F4E5E